MLTSYIVVVNVASYKMVKLGSNNLTDVVLTKEATIKVSRKSIFHIFNAATGPFYWWWPTRVIKTK